jgi:hypothetical protein
MMILLASTCVACATAAGEKQASTAQSRSCRLGERSVIDRMWDEKQGDLDVFMITTRCQKTALGWLLYGPKKSP